MDYFENIVKKILENEDKWVKQNVKVNLTSDEKRIVGKPTIPRPDIDIVTYQPSINTLEIWEVKSYLDSKGVRYKDIQIQSGIQSGRYKLLTSKKYQDVIVNRLKEDWIKKGIIKKNVIVKIAFAAGKLVKKDEDKIIEYCNKQNWRFLSPADIKKGLEKLSELSYENDPYTIAAKIFFRN